MWNPESEECGPESRERNTESEECSPESKKWNRESREWNPESEECGPEFRERNTESEECGPESREWNLEPRVWNPESRERNTESKYLWINSHGAKLDPKAKLKGKVSYMSYKISKPQHRLRSSHKYSKRTYT